MYRLQAHMSPPFTSEEFFEVLAAYNETFWPLQLLWVTLALVAAALSIGRTPRANRIISGILALMWLWMGIGYHWLFFLKINPAARLFGAAFVLEGLLIAFYGFKRDGLRFEAEGGFFGLAGLALVVYALVVYPAFGAMMGHRYPDQPTFGLPCPTTIFTMGVLLWGRPRIPWPILVIPVLWSIIGLNAVWLFGVVEDFMLPVAAIGGGALVLWKNRQVYPSPSVT